MKTRSLHPDEPQLRPMLWLTITLTITLSLLTLYMPFQFQAYPQRFVLPFLRFYGAGFGLAATLLTAAVADVGMPPWALRAGQVLLLAVMLAWGFSVAVLPHVMTGELLYGLLWLCILLAMWFPHHDNLVAHSFYILLAAGLGVLMLPDPATFPGGPLPGPVPQWLAPLFLITACLHAAVMVGAPAASPWRSAVLPTVAIPFAILAWIGAQAQNWLGTTIYIVLSVSACAWAVRLRYAWHIRLPGLRRRVIALGVLLSVVPVLVLGAVAVYAVQRLSEEQGMQLLRSQVYQLEDQLTDYIAEHPNQLPSPGILNPLLRLTPPDPDTSFGVYALSDVPDDWTGGPEAQSREEIREGTPRRLVAYLRRPDLGLMVVVTKPSSIALARSRQLSYMILLIDGVVMLVAAAVGLLTARQMTKRLGELRTFAAALGQQHFAVRVPTPEGHTDDEVGDLWAAVNGMAGALQAYSDEVSSYTDALRAHGRMLSATAHRQAVIAELGRHALSGINLATLMNEAALMVADALAVPVTQVLELMPDGHTFRHCAGSGWPSDQAATFLDRSESPGAVALLEQQPVIMEDLRQETRFQPGPLLEHGVASGVIVVIHGHEQPFGVLGAYSREPGAFAHEDVHFLQSVANVLATAIERRHSEETLRRSSQEIVTIFESITDAFFALDHDWCFTYVNHQAEQVLEQPREQLVGRVIWDSFEAALGTAFERGLQKAARTQVPVSFETYYQPLNAWFDVHAYPSSIGLSVYFRDITVRRRADEERAELLMREQGARQKAEAAQQRLAFLAEASRLLAASLDYETTLATIAEMAVPALGDWCHIHTLEDDDTVRPVAVAHVNPAKLPLARRLARLFPSMRDSSGALAPVFEQRRSVLVATVSDNVLQRTALDDDHLALLRQMNIDSYMLVPLVARDRALGVIAFGSTDSGRHFDEADLALAEDVARRGAMAIDHARLYREAREAVRRKEESLALLDSLLANAPVGFALIDKELRYVRINESLAAMNGLSEEEHIGRSVADIVPDLAAAILPDLQGILRTELPVVNWEISGQHPSTPGVVHHLLGTLYPVHTPAGELLGIGAVVKDITDRKEMELALRRNERLLSGQMRILELIVTGANLQTILTGLVQFLEEVSPHSRCALFLLDQSGVNLRLAAAPSLPPAFSAAFGDLRVKEQAGPCGTAVYRRMPIIVTDVATDPLCRDRRESALELGLRSLWCIPVPGSRGDVLGVLSFYHTVPSVPDPDDQRLMEIATHLAGIAVERNRAEEARSLKLQSLVEHMAEGVVAVDEERRILVINPAAYRLLNLPAPLPEAVALSTEFPAPLVQMLEQATQPGRTEPARATISHRERELEAYVSPVLAQQDRSYGAIALLQDVTAEAQFRRLQDSFVANVSHELRGPLASLSAMVEAMHDGMIPAGRESRYLKAMLAEMGRLRRLTYDLLELSRLQAGMLTIAREPFDLQDLCRGIAELWGQRCAAAEVALTVDAPSLVVCADFDRVDQVLTCLLDNAVRFTPPGGRIHIAARREGDRARLIVHDTGVGIPADHLPYVWERFYKVDQARTRKPESGTGLGLAIARQLVISMGGEVAVESEPGVGSTFSFTVPLNTPT